jgi:hypothetical protein
MVPAAALPVSPPAIAPPPKAVEPPPSAAAPPPKAVAPKSDAAPNPAPRSEGVPLWAWISGSLGLIALGVSGGFGVSAANTHSVLVAACGGNAARCPASTQPVTVPLANERNQAGAISIGFGAAAVVGIGIAVVGIVRAPSKPPTSKTSFHVAPFASPSSGGLTLQGQF